MSMFSGQEAGQSLFIWLEQACEKQKERWCQITQGLAQLSGCFPELFSSLHPTARGRGPVGFHCPVPPKRDLSEAARLCVCVCPGTSTAGLLPCGWVGGRVGRPLVQTWGHGAVT